MSSSTVVLPDAERMMKALKAVMDDPDLVEKLYSEICNDLAGQEKSPETIYRDLIIALHESEMNLPANKAPMIYSLVPNLLWAIVPDEDAYNRTLAAWNEEFKCHRVVSDRTAV